MRIIVAMLALCLALALGTGGAAAAPFGSNVAGVDIQDQASPVEKVHRRGGFYFGYGVPYYGGYGYGYGYYPRYRYVPAPYYYYPAPRYYGYYGYGYGHPKKWKKWKKRDWDDDWDD